MGKGAGKKSRRNRPPKADRHGPVDDLERRAAALALEEEPAPPPPPPRADEAAGDDDDEWETTSEATEDEAQRVFAGFNASAKQEALNRAVGGDAVRERAAPPEGRLGSHCPICLENWDVNVRGALFVCCISSVCNACLLKLMEDQERPCPLCRRPLFLDTHEETLARLQKHVDDGVPLAISHLAMAYRNGDYGLRPSRKESMRLCQRAADLGDVDALNMLAEAHREGLGVKRDEKKAFKYYRMAAEQEDADALYALAMCYHHGCGVARDAAEAAKLCKRAADQGLTQAELQLGIYYAQGVGVGQNMAESRRLLALAAKKGDVNARMNLEQLRRMEQPQRGRRRGGRRS